MWVFNILLGLFMIVTGFALYSEGLGLGSWADTMFGWALPLMGGSQNVKMLHTFGMWLFIMFTVIHIYMAIRADFMGKQSSLMTIINGWRTYKDKA
jgi:Ni/Fe-hydrogenase 1 B-type cytochrome subunit